MIFAVPRIPFVRNVAAKSLQTSGLLARCVLDGESSALIPLFDCLQEEGVKEMTGLEVGENYYVETVTKYYVGELLAVDFSGITLVKAAWIPSTGRYNEAFKSGVFEEVEPLPLKTPLYLPAGVVSAIVEWSHKLPREVK